MIYIGIDPDTDKSGVAIYCGIHKKIELYNLELPQLIEKIKNYEKISKQEILVVIEKGENNKSIFHTSKTKAIAGAIGVKVGKNFQVTSEIEKFMIYLGIRYEFFTPNKHTPKWNHKFAKSMFGFDGDRSNQEQRDALRCIAKYYKN